MTVWTVPQAIPILRQAGFGTVHRVPGEPHGLTPLEMAICVALAESGLNDHAVAVGDQHGCDSVGWFQLNGCHYPYADLEVATFNARWAHAESSGGMSWAPWCTVYGNPCGQCGHRSPGDSYLRAVTPNRQCPSNSSGVPAYFRNVATAKHYVRGQPGPHGVDAPPLSTRYVPPVGAPPDPAVAVRGESAAGLIHQAGRDAKAAAARVVSAASGIRRIIEHWR